MDHVPKDNPQQLNKVLLTSGALKWLNVCNCLQHERWGTIRSPSSMWNLVIHSVRSVRGSMMLHAWNIERSRKGYQRHPLSKSCQSLSTAKDCGGTVLQMLPSRRLRLSRFAVGDIVEYWSATAKFLSNSIRLSAPNPRAWGRQAATTQNRYEGDNPLSPRFVLVSEVGLCNHFGCCQK